MSTSPRRGGGLRAFRLGEIGIRLRGADVALRREPSLVERMRIGLIAENPPPTTYWVSREAWDRIMGAKP